MSDESPPSGEEEESSRRRLLALLLAAVLALVGSGTGIRNLFGNDDEDGSGGGPSLSIDYSVTPDDREPTPTPTPTADRGVSSVTYPRNPDQSDANAESGGSDEGSDTESSPTPEPWREDDPDDPPQSGGGGTTADVATATPTPAPTPTPTAPSDLVETSIPPVSVADVAPGDGGDVELALTLSGSPARLWVRGEANGFEERGFSESERGLDDTSDVGELQDHVQVRLWYESTAGDVTIYEGPLAGLDGVGGPEGWAPMTEACVAPGKHTVHLRWDLPADDPMVNEVQTDAASFSLSVAADANEC